MHKWVKVFKNGLSKICGRYPLKILLDPFLNTLTQILCIILETLTEQKNQSYIFSYWNYFPLLLRFFWKIWNRWEHLILTAGFYFPHIYPKLFLHLKWTVLPQENSISLTEFVLNKNKTSITCWRYWSRSCLLTISAWFRCSLWHFNEAMC